MSEFKKSPPPQAGVARVPAQSTLPRKELQRYIDSGSVIELKEGQILFEQGSEPEEMYAVLSGVLAVIMDGVQIAEIGETEVAGEMAFFLGEKRGATVRALTDCVVHPISPKKMAMLLQHGSVVLGLMRMYARRVEATNRALKVRTETAMHNRLAREEAERQRTAAEAQLAAALGNLAPANARIAELEKALRGLGYELKQDGALTRRFARPVRSEPPPAALELDLEEDLATLAPPPEPPPLPQVPKLRVSKPRRDETVQYATARRAPAVSDTEETEAFAEVGTDEVTVLAGPQMRQRHPLPVGARTQSMVAFDPDAHRQEMIVDDSGSRPSDPGRSEVDIELDQLLADFIRNDLGKGTPQR